MNKQLLMVCFCLSLASAAFADWSPEIELWHNPPNIGLGWAHTAIGIDSAGGVHIAYMVDYRPPWDTLTYHEGMVYTKFDDHGHQVVPPIFISDSAVFGAREPQIILFGMDSLWVMWRGGRMGNPWRTYYVSAFSTDECSLGPVRSWREFQDGMDDSYVLASDPLRRVVFARATETHEIRVTVITPDGQLLMDDARVWSRPDEFPDCLTGFLDTSDSLQLTWRERTYVNGALFAKRISIGSAYDSSHVTDYTALTPVSVGSYYALPVLYPAGDTLMLFLGAFPGEPNCGYRLTVVRRHDYSELSHIQLGYCSTIVRMESDSVISMVQGVSDPGGRQNVDFRRYHLPNLELLQDTCLVRETPPEDETELRAYEIARSGVRHLVYIRAYPGATGRLCYRYWRADLAIGGHTASTPASEFTIYPNPTNGSAMLSGPLGSVKTIVLYNVLGQQVRTLSSPSLRGNSSTLPIEFDGLPSGSYYLNITLHDGTIDRHAVQLIR
jgi:hypothetical protein